MLGNIKDPGFEISLFAIAMRSSYLSTIFCCAHADRD